jgi:hypothetical protein
MKELCQKTKDTITQNIALEFEETSGKPFTIIELPDLLTSLKKLAS